MRVEGGEGGEGEGVGVEGGSEGEGGRVEVVRVRE